MKGIFLGFLSVSLSGSLIICLVMGLRLLFKKAPRALICILWALAIVRLLLPFQIETSFSLRPDTPVFSVSTPSTAEQNPAQTVEITNNTLDIPVVRETGNREDLWQISSCVWAAGVVVMLLYTLISYLRLKSHLANAAALGDGVYASEKLDSAILLGYFNPRIYLPATINDSDIALVIAHERAHLRRGDNWLKLFGFISLAFHWFNPLVWAAYLLLCRDVEDACDQQVIRKLDIEGKKRYSAALLSCGRQKRSLSVCPVAFGEISVRQRIKNVLSYRKPALWICIFAMVAIIVAAVFFMTDPVQKHPPYFETMSSMIGKSVAETCQALGISENELETYGDRERIFETPVYVSYQGMTFRLRLLCGEYPEGVMTLYAFEYCALYDPEDTQLEVDLVGLSRHLWKCFGETDTSIDAAKKEPELLSYISKKTIRRTVNDYVDEGVRTAILSEHWDVSQDVASKTKKSIDAFCDFRYDFIKEHTTYSGDVPIDYTPVTEYLTHHMTLSFVVRYGLVSDRSVQELDKIGISLLYGLHTTKDKIPTYVAAHIEEQNWWHKFLNWLK